MDKNQEINWSSFERLCNKWLIRQRETLNSEPILCPYCNNIVPLIENCESCKKILLERFYKRNKGVKFLLIVTFIFLAGCFIVFGYFAVDFIFVKLFPELGIDSPTIKVFVALVLSGIILSFSKDMIIGAFKEIKSENVVELSRQSQLYNASLKFKKEKFLSQSVRCLAEYISYNKVGEAYLAEHFLSNYKKMLFSDIKPLKIDVIFKNIFIYESYLQLCRESMAFDGVKHNLVWGMKGKILKIISIIITDNDELILLAKEFQKLPTINLKLSKVLVKLVENAKPNAPIVSSTLSE